MRPTIGERTFPCCRHGVFLPEPSIRRRGVRACCSKKPASLRPAADGRTHRRLSWSPQAACLDGRSPGGNHIVTTQSQSLGRVKRSAYAYSREPGALRRTSDVRQHTLRKRSMQVASTSSPGRFHQFSRREDLDLLRAVIAGRLDRRADAFEVDDAVAHHAAIEQQVARRHQPVADVVREDACLPRRPGRSAASAPDPTRHGRRRSPRRRPRRAASQMSSACFSVFTQARSAAYIGCSGSIASGTPLARACGRIAAMPSATMSRARRDVAASPAAGRRPPAPGNRRRALRPRRWRAGCRRSPLARPLGVGRRKHAAAAEPGDAQAVGAARCAPPRRGRSSRPGRATARSP